MDQQAKKHLQEEFDVTLEEKDQMISVLQTQVSVGTWMNNKEKDVLKKLKKSNDLMEFHVRVLLQWSTNIRGNISHKT